MTFLPLAMLVLVDIAIISYIILTRLAGREKGSQGFLSQAASLVDTKSRSRKYQSLEDAGIPLEASITFCPASTGFTAAVIDNFVYGNDLPDNDKPSSDLQLFVQSLTKCMGSNRSGLSFEFNDLKFQPRKSTKPILSEVTGYINGGSLCGVMGASGAGKCMTKSF
jgi:ABC-type multidrug transport system fused ATPase/permease subunit